MDPMDLRINLPLKPFFFFPLHRPTLVHVLLSQYFPPQILIRSQFRVFDGSQLLDSRLWVPILSLERQTIGQSRLA